MLHKNSYILSVSVEFSAQDMLEPDKITTVSFIAFEIAGSLYRYLNTMHSGLVFKQLSQDTVNVNA